MGVTRRVEVGEVELPDAAPASASSCGEVAGGVGEGDAELDEVEGVDVGLEQPVVVFRVAESVIAGRTVDNAGKLGVHGDVRVVVD